MSNEGHVVEKASPPQTALVLAGGGLIGAVYEAGALCAIDEMLVGRTVNDFDLYVGTSAGALVGTMLAHGLTSKSILELLGDRYPGLRSLRAGDVFRTNRGGWFRRVHRLPRLLAGAGWHIVRNRKNTAFSDLAWELTAAAPSGLYDSSAIEAYVVAVLERLACADSFDALAKQMLVVATELDTGQRTVFAPNGSFIDETERGIVQNVSISKAVTASSAVPLLYRPVQINGKDYVDGVLNGVASVDLAIEAGAKLVLCINSLVSLDAQERSTTTPTLRQQGFQAVANQTIRTVLHTGLRYHIKNLRAKYPDVDIVLIEPRQDDARIFSHSPMGYSNRRQMAQHGYETVRAGLLDNLDYFSSIMARHDIRFAPQNLIDSPPIEQSVRLPDGGPAPTNASAAEALERLAARLAQLEVRLDKLVSPTE